MATREQLINALKKADAAGNTEDAKKLANYIKSSSGAFGVPNQQREGTAGFFEGVVGGAKNILSGSQTAVEAPFISGEEAALRGIERQKNRTERPGFSLDEIIKTYDQDGLFSAAGETLSQIPGAIGEQLPFLASMKAGFAAGSALPLPPQAKLLAGVAGSLLTPFLVSSGSAMERKASEQLKRGDKVDINELGAYGTGLASAGLERAALGLSGLSKVMGIDFLKGAGTETAEQIARRSLAATLAKGGGKLVAAEVPTEMGQQALERYYAGLSLTDEEAMREYAEAGAGAAMLAPLGMAGSAYQRSQVKRQIKNAEADTEKKLKEKNRIKEEEDRQNELDEAAMEANRQARIEEDIQIRAAIKAERETALQKAREATGEPVRSIQDIINEMTGVVKPKLDAEGEETGQFQERKPLTGKKLTARQKQFQEGLDEPSGQFVSGVDGVERERTEAEAQGIPVQEYDPTKQKLTKEFITTKKGLGIGGTAKAFGLDHGEGPVPTLKDFLDGKDPTNVEDNGMIRLTLNENLKTRRKGLDDAPSLEAQQKRQEVITKIETYLTALPTTQELENAEYQKALDAEAARRSNEVADESAAADAFLSSVNDTGRTNRPTITDDELARRAGPEPTSLVDPETEQEVDLTGALPKEEFDRQKLEAENKELSRDARVIRQNAKKAPTLRKVLTDIGIARSQMLDITGETKGNTFLFRNDGNEIEDIVSDNQNNILEYAPADMVARFVSDRNQGLFNNELVNFFRDKIRDNDLNIRPAAVQETLFEADNMEQVIEDNKKSIKAKPKTTAPAAAPTQEQSREEYLREINFYMNNRIDGGIYAPSAEPMNKMYERLGMPQTEMSLKESETKEQPTTEPAATPTQQTTTEVYDEIAGTYLGEKVLPEEKVLMDKIIKYFTDKLNSKDYITQQEFQDLMAADLYSESNMNRQQTRRGYSLFMDKIFDEVKQLPANKSPLFLRPNNEGYRNRVPFEVIAGRIAKQKAQLATPTQQTTTEGVVPTFEGKEIPQSLINSSIQRERAQSRAELADAPQSRSARTRLFFKHEDAMTDFLGLTEKQDNLERADEDKIRALDRAIGNILKGEPVGHDYISQKNAINTVNYKIDRSLIDKAKKEGYFTTMLQGDYLGTKDVKTTQEQRVKQTLEESDTPLTIKEIAEQTDILEPNVRRITGQGAKAGKFERVAPGVYTLTTPDGKKIAHIEVGDAVNVLPKLVEQGEKFDMIFLDPAYFSRALIGGNRGIKDYEFMRTPEFKKAMESVPNLIKETDGHVYLMLSGAPSAQQDMLPYLNAMNEVGLSVVGEGEYKKLFKNGKPVTNVRGKEASAERIFLLTKSGIARKGEKTLDNLNFRFVRPSVRSSYSTEKAPQLLNALITNSTFEGESVLDPFAGSGVTGAEAVKAGRQATLVEKSEKAVEDYIIPKIEGAQDDIQQTTTETEGVVPMINGIEIPQSLIDTYQDLDRARRNRFMEEDNPQYKQLLKEAQKQDSKFDKEVEEIFGKDLEGLNYSEMLIERGVSVEAYDTKKFRRIAVEDAIKNVLEGEPIGTKAEDYYFADDNYIAPVKYKINPIQKETEEQIGDSTFYKKVDDIQESRTETEQDKLAFELREAEYQAGSYIKASERVPKRLRDRIKKLKEQLSVQESRSDTLGPIETADSITESLRKEFGSDIDKAIDSGQLVIVNHLHELPNSFKFKPTANGAYDPTSNKVYIVASKVMPGQGRKVLLHELGEHYGLERMLGDSYGATLGRLNSLKNTDPKVKAVWDQVGRQYPDIEVGGKLYLQEVMAKIGEQSPQNTLFKRVVAAVKNFLRKLGFFNPNTLTAADMQDLIMYSTRSALAKSDKVTNNQIIASSLGLTPVQLSVANTGRDKLVTRVLRKMSVEQREKDELKRNEEAKEIGGGFNEYGMTLRSGEMLYHGVPRPLGNRIRDNNNTLLSQPPVKSQSGYTTEGGLIFFHQELDTADAFARQYRRKEQVGPMDRGNVFGYQVERPLKIVSIGYKVNEKEAEMLNKQFNTPVDNFSRTIEAGDTLQYIATDWKGQLGIRYPEYKVQSYRDGKPLPTSSIEDLNIGPPDPYLDTMTTPWPTILNLLEFDGFYNNITSDSGAPQIALGMGDLQTDLMYSKTDVPAGLEQTSVYLSGVKDDSKTFYNNFVGPGLDNLRNQPVDTLASLWNQVRIKMAYSGAGIERKLVNEYEGAVNNGSGVRADIIMSQALDDSVIASQSAAEGKVVLGEDRVARVVIDENNINNLVKLRQQLADQTSIELAEGLIQSYTSARRYRLELDRVEQRAANIASRKQAIKTANQELKTAKGDDKKQLNKLIARYQKQNERDKEKNESITITPEQEAAIEPGLAYAQQYPVLVEVGAMIDAINKNRIDLLEQSGVYTKDMADDYRDREGYVPLFREMIEDLGKGDQTITQYFSGFADIGREYGFTGSDKDTKHVLGNLLQQHFWAVSASLRNNANYEAAKQVGLHDDQNNLILKDKKPETGTAAPVMVDGERKFVEYSDPTLAIGIQGALPVYKGILKWFGLAAKWFRLGITANPVFQTYQVINDALGAAMYSGVRSPLKLGKEIIGGYVRDQYFRDTKAIDDQMARLGIAGGFGRTPGDIFLKAQRQLGVENMTKWQKLVDATDAFASRSDLAQRRGIFVQTLLESGGVRQADGSVAGGNEIEAMNRALNIINWQKRGASSSVRTMTHVIPFANAYLQGMDVLLNAMAGKGLSGTDAQTARILFLKTALALTMFNMLYSMVVAGEEEYEELDDRIKFRNYIVPGTGFKLPVRAEISLLTKYIPEQAYQYVTKLGTTNEVDATKLFNGMSLAVRDAAMGPNLFPQLIRGSVEVATNYNFYSGRPLIGLGLSRLDTAEQYNEATSELAKLLGSTGMVAPINADHIIRSYFGTVGSTALFVMDQAANTMIGNEKPAMRLKDIPLISPLLYTAQGRDKLNDFYELKQASDEATATVNRLMKYDPKKAFEYRKDNARMIGTRKQVNRLSKNLKDLRARRKLIIESGMDGDKKRAALTNVEKQMNNVVRSIARLRIASGL